MDINDTIMLDDGSKYTLLEKTVRGGNTYFLAIGLRDDDREDFEDVVIFKECEEADGVYVEVEQDSDTIVELSKIFEEMINSEV